MFFGSPAGCGVFGEVGDLLPFRQLFELTLVAMVDTLLRLELLYCVKALVEVPALLTELRQLLDPLLEPSPVEITELALEAR